MKKDKYQIFESLNKRKKKYIVTGPFDSISERIDLFCYAKRFFRVSGAHIVVEAGWIYKGKLYLENPLKPGTKPCNVAYYYSQEVV